MSITVTSLMQQRRFYRCELDKHNPTLLSGEIGYETDTGYLKIGDGSTAWTSLVLLYSGTKVDAYPLATADIANDAITADKLADTAVTAGSYTTADITLLMLKAESLQLVQERLAPVKSPTGQSLPQSLKTTSRLQAT